MMTLFALAALQASIAGTNAPPPVVSVHGTPVYVDRTNGVFVDYVELPIGRVHLLSKLPAGWSFSVDVDGDQNGVWGLRAGLPDPSVFSSPDYKFGQDRNGVLCSQYIFTHWAHDPASIYLSSECGELRSNGQVTMSGFDDNMRATVVLEIPSDEFFRDRASARIQVCVWDTKKSLCQHSMPELLELERKFPPSAPPKP